MDTLRDETQKCATLQRAIFYTRCGKWYKLHTDNIEDVDLYDLTAMKFVRDELTVHSDNILLRNDRIVLPKTLHTRDKSIVIALYIKFCDESDRDQTIPRHIWQRAVNIAHEGHQGATKTKAILRSKVWLPGMDGVVEEAVKNCAKL